MGKLIFKYTFALLAMFLILPTSVYADDTEVTVTVPALFMIEVIGELEWSGSQCDGEDFYEGYADDDGLQIRIYANVDWELNIEGTGGNTFTFENVGENSYGDPGKLVGDIEWHDGADPGWHPLTTGPVYINWGNFNPGSYAEQPVAFRIALDWTTDCPGIYTYDAVLFTATSH